MPEHRTGPLDPSLTDEDIEAAADAALAEDVEDLKESSTPHRVRRLQHLGANLGARAALSDRRRRKFLRELALSGVVSQAAAAAGWSRSTAVQLRKSDPQFKALWDQALEFATDILENAARSRAVHGTDRPVFQQGQLVGHVTEYSDSLLALLLKAYRADRFRDNVKVDADVKGGVLVVPGIAQSGSSWENAAGSQQAGHRSNSGEGDAD